MKTLNTTTKQMEMLTPEECLRVTGGSQAFSDLGHAAIETDGGLLKTAALGVTLFGLVRLCKMMVS